MAARRFSIYWPAPSDLGSAAPVLITKVRTAAPAPAAAVSSPIAIPGSEEALPPWSLRPATPQQGGEGKRPALLRQASDAKLDAADGTAEADTLTGTPVSPAAAPPPAADQALGSWAARQTVLPLPPRPVGFPAPATKARLQPAMPRPQRSAADAAWRYRFRQKWRREQLRYLLDGPDNSPDDDADGASRTLDSLDGDDGMVFWLEGVLAAAGNEPGTEEQVQEVNPSAMAAALPATAPQPAAHRLAPVPTAAQKAAPLAVTAAAAPTKPLQVKVATAVEPAADPLQAALPGLPPIRKAIMRGTASRGGGRRSPVAMAGKATAAQGAGALGVKVQAPPQQGRWVPPEWPSPARASQAA